MYSEIIYTMNHKNLMDKAQKWIKNTSPIYKVHQ